ncbi:MAG: cupin domain-containing protein [Planctomycetes bacterium]|nr:cupin domain-containing protein [Planctomycetota bacterium]
MPAIKDVIVKKPTDQEVETCKNWPIWQGQVSTFDWGYTQIETCLIIEGKVTVTDRPAGDDSITFGPGDMVVFPEGLECIWNIQEPVRKYYQFS